MFVCFNTNFQPRTTFHFFKKNRIPPFRRLSLINKDFSSVGLNPFANPRAIDGSLRNAVASKNTDAQLYHETHASAL